MKYLSIILLITGLLISEWVFAGKAYIQVTNQSCPSGVNCVGDNCTDTPSVEVKYKNYTSTAFTLSPQGGSHTFRYKIKNTNNYVVKTTLPTSTLPTPVNLSDNKANSAIVTLNQTNNQCVASVQYNQ